MKSPALKKLGQGGFTLIEILVSCAIIASLFALTTINLASPVETATVGSVVDTIIADLKSQQLNAIAGNDGGTTSAQPQGIHIQMGSYILFAGAAYSAVDPNNFTLAMDSGISLSTSFLNSRVIFNKGDGEVQGFVNGSNTITVNGRSSSKIITINRLGAVTVN